MSKTESKASELLPRSLRQKFVRLRRILAFIVLASEDRCRVATLFSNTHLLFENESDKRGEYAAVNRDFLWWWYVRNAVKDFIKRRIAKW